jgi:hypothetical protein
VHAFVGYWVVPAAFLFACGVVIALLRRALRRPPIKPPARLHRPSRIEAVGGVGGSPPTPTRRIGPVGAPRQTDTMTLFLSTMKRVVIPCDITST